ncbi:MAG: class II aldolase/adducin family protein, partial [Methylobacterium sp.]
MLDDEQTRPDSVAIDLPNDDSGRKRTSIYQPEQAGLIFPEMPDFANHAEEREYRKKHLVAACRAFAMHGFDYG